MRVLEYRSATLVLTATLAVGLAQAAPSPVREPVRDDCGLEPPAVAAGAPAVPRRPEEAAVAVLARRAGGPRARVAVPGRTPGALTGKTVYVSAGHGWTFAAGAWRTQRGNTNDIVEDLVSAEVIDQYLVQFLEGMGADVVTVRERDLNPARVVVDDADARVTGGIVEGAAGPAGYAEVPTPIADQTNPLTAGGTRTLTTAASARGEVVYAPAIPASGHYVVYVAYAAGADRAPDAHYIVRHAGGESHRRVDQRRHGSTWVALGRFYFEADAPEARASVAVADDSATPGAVVSLDAVRLGGGVGVIDRGGGVSGRPMWENNARYHAQLSGAPPAVYDYTDTDGNDDVGTRSRFAAWDHEDGEDAVFISWHTNAPDPGRGTESYTYGPSAPPGPLSEFSGVAGSLELQAAVHDELVADIHAALDPGWPDRGKRTAFFGEVNPTHNPETPAVLVEIGFHDTPADADQLRTPRFRRIAARALAQGVARYFASRDGQALTLPPEPPTALRVENDGAGGLRVAWRPPTVEAGGGDPATGYRVYVGGGARRGGIGFDDGTAVGGESTVLTGLSPGEARFVRVSATNAGGESLPSEIVGARVGAAPVLVVGGFDRLDGGQLLREDLSARFLETVDRMLLERMNDGSSFARHGVALIAAGVSFDGASDEAIAQADVDLRAYQAIDWFTGEDSSADAPFDAATRAELAAFLAGGGRLLVSGSELAWALDLMGTPEEQAFYRDSFQALYAGDDAGTYAITPAAGPYQTLPGFRFDDPSAGAYDADFPDQLTPGPAATLALGYEGGAGGGAAVAWGAGAAAGSPRGVVLGFPFETIDGEDTRAAVMQLTLAFLEVEPDGFPPDAGPGGGGGDGSGLAGACGCEVGGRGRRPAGGLLLGALAALLLISGARLGTLRGR